MKGFKAIGANIKGRYDDRQQRLNKEAEVGFIRAAEGVGIGENFRLAKRGDSAILLAKLNAQDQKAAEERMAGADPFGRFEQARQLQAITTREDRINARALIAQGKNDLPAMSDAERTEYYRMLNLLSRDAHANRDGEQARFVMQSLKDYSKIDPYFNTPSSAADPTVAQIDANGNLVGRNQAEGIKSFTLQQLRGMRGTDVADAIMRNLLSTEVVRTLDQRPDILGEFRDNALIRQAINARRGYAQLPAGVAPVVTNFGFTSNRFARPSVDQLDAPDPKLAEYKEQNGIRQVTVGSFTRDTNPGNHLAVDLTDPRFAALSRSTGIGEFAEYGQMAALHLGAAAPGDTEAANTRRHFFALVGQMYQEQLQREQQVLETKIQEAEKANDQETLAKLQARALTPEQIDAQVGKLLNREQANEGLIVLNTARAQGHPIHLLHHEQAHEDFRALPPGRLEQVWGTIGQDAQGEILTQMRERTKGVALSEIQLVEEYFAEGIANTKPHAEADDPSKNVRAVRLEPAVQQQLEQLLAVVRVQQQARASIAATTATATQSAPAPQTQPSDEDSDFPYAPA